VSERWRRKRQKRTKRREREENREAEKQKQTDLFGVIFLVSFRIQIKFLESFHPLQVLFILREERQERKGGEGKVKGVSKKQEEERKRERERRRRRRAYIFVHQVGVTALVVPRIEGVETKIRKEDRKQKMR
jgi:hypothetical protein